MSRRTVLAVLFALGALIPLVGCAHRLPPVVPAEGTVLLNGKPLPKASVTFVPMLDHFGAESNSLAVTDDHGRFTLTCSYNNRPGAVVGKHVVLITEPPLPDDLRNGRDNRAIERYREQLGNRPIPLQYNSVSTSPLQIEVKVGQTEYTLELTR